MAVLTPVILRRDERVRKNGVRAADTKDEPPTRRKALRDLQSRPLLDAFFAWAEAEYAKVKDTRGLLRSALGYAVRQQGALRRFLDDG